ncbi:MAG: hypothetical protein B7Z37_14070 [Verrucomicrobia bacterium 12-59-8]|nr:MAG: hypothetical protein B7Z37_14070 [Verrucomicrobia bacterium 12-59-8]
MHSRLLLLSLILPLFIASCATRLACDFSAPRLPWKHPKTPKDGREEARVGSYIVGCTEDGFTLSEVNRINHLPQCGMDLFATFLTLGLIPHSAPNPIRATVTGYVDGRQKTETFALSLDRHTSLWHNLLPERHDDRAIARAVLQAVRHRKELDPKMHQLLNQYGKLELEELKANKR